MKATLKSMLTNRHRFATPKAPDELLAVVLLGEDMELCGVGNVRPWLPIRNRYNPAEILVEPGRVGLSVGFGRKDAGVSHEQEAQVAFTAESRHRYLLRLPDDYHARRMKSKLAGESLPCLVLDVTVAGRPRQVQPAARVTRLYGGPTRPAEEVATLAVEELIRFHLVGVDGVRVEESGQYCGVPVYQFLPGTYRLLLGFRPGEYPEEPTFRDFSLTKDEVVYVARAGEHSVLSAACRSMTRHEYEPWLVGPT